MYFFPPLLLGRGKKILADGAERVGEQTTKQEDRKLETQSTGSKKINIMAALPGGKETLRMRWQREKLCAFKEFYFPRRLLLLANAHQKNFNIVLRSLLSIRFYFSDTAKYH